MTQPETTTQQGLIIHPTDEIKFKGPYTQPVTEYLYLQNPSPDRLIVFKVKTTAPTRYNVRPVSGIVQAEAAVTISIALLPIDEPGDGTRFDPRRQKFMIQWAMYPNETDTSNLSDLLLIAQSSGQLEQVLLMCTFDQLEQYHLPVTENPTNRYNTPNQVEPNPREHYASLVTGPNHSHGYRVWLQNQQQRVAHLLADNQNEDDEPENPLYVFLSPGVVVAVLIMILAIILVNGLF